MFKDFNETGVQSGNWNEAINGVDNEFFLEFSKNQILAIQGKKQEDTDSKILIQIDQIKLLQYQVSANNQYKYTLMQRSLAGGNLGNISAQGRIIFRDGLEGTIEYIKKQIFNNVQMLRESIGKYSISSDSTESDFIEVLNGETFEDFGKIANNLTYEENDISKISFTQLPSFDLKVYSKKSNSAGIKSKNIIKNVRFISVGNSSSIDDLEQNSIVSFEASNVTGWQKI